MSTKMVNLGARVPQEDVEFISRLTIAGATTPSDKVRAIIAEARRRNEGLADYNACLDDMNALLSPLVTRIRRLEMEHNIHSEAVLRTLEWLPDMMAFVTSGGQRLHGEDAPDALITFEKNLVDRVFRLMASVLQMGVTPACPCYDSGAIGERLQMVLDLARVIEQARVSSAEEKN